MLNPNVTGAIGLIIGMVVGAGGMFAYVDWRFTLHSRKP